MCQEVKQFGGQDSIAKEHSCLFAEEEKAKFWRHQGCVPTTLPCFKDQWDLVMMGSIVSDLGESVYSVLEKESGR